MTRLPHQRRRQRAGVAIVVLLAAAVVATLASPARATTAPGDPSGRHHPAVHVLPGSNVFPEGIATDGSYLYVGSNSTGAVYRGRLESRTTSLFLPPGADGRTSLTGLQVAGRRLILAGGATGQLWVYDLPTRRLLSRWTVPGGVAAGATFVNDEALGADGSVFVTDSFRPVLYRLRRTQVQGRPRPGIGVLPVWLDLAGRIPFGAGFNVNGADVTADGRYLLAVTTNTGRLYRVRLANREVRRVEVSGSTLVDGDGLLLRHGQDVRHAAGRGPGAGGGLGPGGPLYVVRNVDNQVARLALSADALYARVVLTATAPTFKVPTSLIIAGGRMLLPNSQFGAATPIEPFTVSDIPVP
jgi:hypothetical protein